MPELQRQPCSQCVPSAAGTCRSQPACVACLRLTSSLDSPSSSSSYMHALGKLLPLSRWHYSLSRSRKADTTWTCWSSLVWPCPSSLTAACAAAHHLVLLVMLFSCFSAANACSSRSTPKPRPQTHSTMRPNITFQTYACPPAYAAWYCLNGATCFTVKIADSILYNCECADGYMGQRCEFKDLDGSYLPSRERFLMLGAGSSSLSQAFIAVLLIVMAAIAISVIFTVKRTQLKRRARAKQQPGFQPQDSCDFVYGMSMRPQPHMKMMMPFPEPTSAAFGDAALGHHGTRMMSCSPIVSGSAAPGLGLNEMSVLGQSISYSLSRHDCARKTSASNRHFHY